MATSISVQTDVIDQVRWRLHLPAFSSSSFVTTSDILALVKSSGRRLSGLLTRLYGDAFFAETATLTTVAGFDLVSLPSNFATLRSLHWIDGNNALELARANPGDYDPEAVAWGSISDIGLTSATPTYALEANVIRLTPTPAAAYTLRLGYTSGIFITAASDTIQGQIGWDEWMILDCCQRIREREQKNASEFIRDRLELEEQIKDQASQRDRYANVQVVDRRGIAKSRENRLWRR